MTEPSVVESFWQLVQRLAKIQTSDDVDPDAASAATKFADTCARARGHLPDGLVDTASQLDRLLTSLLDTPHDAAASASATALAWRRAGALASQLLRHRARAYEHERFVANATARWHERRQAYEPVRVGVVSANDLRTEARALVDALRSAGHDAVGYVYERFPVALPLAAHFEGIGEKHQVVVVLLADETENGEWALGEACSLQLDDRSDALFLPLVIGSLQPSRPTLLLRANDRSRLGDATGILLRFLRELRVSRRAAT